MVKGRKMDDPLFDILNVIAVIEGVEQKPGLAQTLLDYIDFLGSSWLSLPENKDPYRVISELTRLTNYSIHNRRLRKFLIEFTYKEEAVFLWLTSIPKNYAVKFTRKSSSELDKQYHAWIKGEQA